MVASVRPLTATIRPFLSAAGHTGEEVGAMYQAWFKSVTLQAALWTRPYLAEGWQAPEGRRRPRTRHRSARHGAFGRGRHTAPARCRRRSAGSGA
jgi:hypothetical protein